MSILSKLFGGQQPVAAAPATPALPGNMPAQNNNPASANNPTAPASTVAATGTPDAPNVGATPEGLDKFADMWNIPDDQKPKAPESAFAGVTPEALQQIAGKTDFSKVVTPEMMQAISAGGEQGVAATIQALNAVAQQTYAQSAGATMKLIDTALEKQRTQFQAELPNLIKQQTVTETLRNTNPIFNHPAAAPMLDTLQKQLQQKNPTATADQIRKQAEEYLVSFASAATPQSAQQQQAANKLKEPDWSDWV
jgi:hypothetical protein